MVGGKQLVTDWQLELNFGARYGLIGLNGSGKSNVLNAGFLAKVFVLLSLVFSGYKIAAVILVLISAISVFYYVRVIKVVFFEPEGVKTQNQRFHTLFNKDFFDLDCMIMGVCLFSLIFFFFYPSLLILTSQNIVLGLFNV